MARKLTIRTKLAAVLAVPLVMLAVFAGFQVNGAHERSDQLKTQAALATTAVGPSGVVDALVTERDFETYRVLGLEKKAVGLGVKNSRAAEDSTDGKVGDFRTNLGALGAGISGSYTPALAVTLSKLNGDHGLRAEVEDLASHAGAANAEKAQVVFNAYTSVIEGLLDADQQATAGIDDAQTRTGVELLNALNRQNDVESQVVIDTAIASLAQDPVLARHVQNVVGMQLRGDDDLRTRAGNANYGRALLPALQAPLRAKAVAEMKAAAADPVHAKIATLLSLPHGSGLLRSAVSNVAGLVAERSTARTVAAQNDQRNWIGLTIVSLLVAIAMLWFTRRWITGPLRELADQAGAMANDRLPTAVNEILETPLEDEVVRPDVAPVLVKAGGEVRAVADALNAVQESALSLAVEQASLRRNVADAYVNLGRRNQNLLSRQLEFISQLETDESDPETLEHLFKLDHLATRMRRNAESLLVLAGNAPPRTWGAPVAVSDVVRGALGEVEGYQRVRLRHLDDGRVDGAAAADVSHVVAELTENALAFSPPDAEVEVYGRRDDYGYVLTIVDSGIGMSAEDLQHANELISAPNELSLAPSRYLGHYVVGQLAARHELTVHLAASPGGGLTAMIVLPAALLGITPPAPASAVDVDALPPDTLDVTAAERPTLTLPRRESAADDVPEPAAASDAEVLAAPEAAVVALPMLSLAPEPEPETEPDRESERAPEGAPVASAELSEPVTHESLADVQPAPAEPAIEPPAPEPAPEPAPDTRTDRTRVVRGPSWCDRAAGTAVGATEAAARARRCRAGRSGSRASGGPRARPARRVRRGRPGRRCRDNPRRLGRRIGVRRGLLADQASEARAAGQEPADGVGAREAGGRSHAAVGPGRTAAVGAVDGRAERLAGGGRRGHARGTALRAGICCARQRQRERQRRRSRRPGRRPRGRW